MKQFFEKYTWFSKIFCVVVGIAGIVSAIYCVRTFYNPSEPPSNFSSNTESHKAIAKGENNEVRNSKIESHTQTSQPKINAKNSNVQIGPVIGDVNQTVNIDEFPEPQFEFQVISENVEAGENFKTEVFLTIESKTQLKNLYLEARASSIISFDAKPQRTGMAMFGHSGDRQDFSFINIPSAWGKYKLIIISKFPEKVEITYDYK